MITDSNYLVMTLFLLFALVNCEPQKKTPAKMVTAKFAKTANPCRDFLIWQNKSQTLTYEKPITITFDDKNTQYAFQFKLNSNIPTKLTLSHLAGNITKIADSHITRQAIASRNRFTAVHDGWTYTTIINNKSVTEHIFVIKSDQRGTLKVKLHH